MPSVTFTIVSDLEPISNWILKMVNKGYKYKLDISTELHYNGIKRKYSKKGAQNMLRVCPEHHKKGASYIRFTIYWLWITVTHGYLKK